MQNTPPTPVCAFSVSSDGAAQPIPVPDTLSGAQTDGAYLWLHFDVKDAAFAPWIKRHLPPTAAAALVQPETRPRCDRLKDGMVLNLRGVNLNPGADADDMVSLRLWVSEGLIISARMRKVWAVDSIREQMDNGTGPTSVAAFLSMLASGLTKRIETVSLAVVEDTDRLEEQALSPEQSLATELATLRQSVIKLRRFVRPQTRAIAVLAEGTVWPLDPTSASHLRETTNQTTRIMEELDATADRLQATQDHLDMLHAAALGRNSYVLSIVAAIFLPLGFLTGLFGINVGGMPGVEAAYGFWAVTVSSLIIGVLLLLVFRYLKWL